jgi:hypothetical protein
MMLTRLFTKCKSWRCKAEIALDGIPGFYFRGDELKYEGSSFRVACKGCGKSHKYKLRDVIVRRGGDAITP